MKRETLQKIKISQKAIEGNTDAVRKPLVLALHYLAEAELCTTQEEEDWRVERAVAILLNHLESEK